MLSRVFAFVFVFSTVLPVAFAADRYAAIKERLGEKYDDESCTLLSTTPFLLTSRLSCVSCAFHKFVGYRPSTKFLSLLAVHAQKSVDLGTSKNVDGSRVQHGRPSQGGIPNAAMLKRVIQSVQAYGACSATTANDAIPVTPIKDLLYRAISGSTSKQIQRMQDGVVVGTENSVGYNSTEQKEIAEFYGFKSFRDIDDLFYDYGFERSTPTRRQTGFIEQVKEGMYRTDDSGQGLKQCIGDLTIQRAERPALNTGNEAENADLCYFMAIECKKELGDDISFCDGGRSVVAPAAAPDRKSPATGPSRDVGPRDNAR